MSAQYMIPTRIPEGNISLRYCASSAGSKPSRALRATCITGEVGQIVIILGLRRAHGSVKQVPASTLLAVHHLLVLITCAARL